MRYGCTAIAIADGVRAIPATAVRPLTFFSLRRHLRRTEEEETSYYRKLTTNGRHQNAEVKKTWNLSFPSSVGHGRIQ